MDDKVETLLNSNLNFLINKIHTLIYDLFDKEILEYMHNSVCFLLKKLLVIKITETYNK